MRDDVALSTTGPVRLTEPTVIGAVTVTTMVAAPGVFAMVHAAEGPGAKQKMSKEKKKKKKKKKEEKKKKKQSETAKAQSSTIGN